MSSDTAFAEISARDHSLFRSLIRTAADGVLVTDEDGVLLIYSAACTRLFQHAPEAVLGNNIAMLLAPSCRDDLRECLSVVTAANKEAATLAPVPVPHEWLGLRQDGTQFPMQMSLGDGSLDGRRVLLGSVHDLTALHRERIALGEETAYLALIVESSNDAIISYMPDGTVRSWNHGAEQMFGYSAEDVVGVNASLLIPIFIPPDLKVAEVAILARALAGEFVPPHESVRLHRNGTPVYVLVSASPIRGADHAIIGASRIVRDLSERRDYELRLEAMRQDMIHVARMHELSLVSAEIAHELNQPLSAILNYSNVARRLVANGDFAKLPEVAQKIGDQAQRASQIIQRMRAFVEKRASHRAIEDINAIADDAVALALIGAKAANIEIKYERAPDAPPALADRVQIQQVIVNLLRNAVEAMSETPRRELALTIRKRDDAFVEVLVSDTGSGIPDEVAARLFTPFVTSKIDGMGIGLAISKTIIEAHGGELTAERNPGGGTIFRFTLPVTMAEASV